MCTYVRILKTFSTTLRNNKTRKYCSPFKLFLHCTSNFHSKKVWEKISIVYFPPQPKKFHCVCGDYKNLWKFLAYSDQVIKFDNQINFRFDQTSNAKENLFGIAQLFLQPISEELKLNSCYSHSRKLCWKLKYIK